MVFRRWRSMTDIKKKNILISADEDQLVQSIMSMIRSHAPDANLYDLGKALPLL